jgi:hypothetical protein
LVIEGGQAVAVEAADQGADGIADPPTDLPGGVGQGRTVSDRHERRRAALAADDLAGGGGNAQQFQPLRLAQRPQRLYNQTCDSLTSSANSPTSLPLWQVSWQMTH